MVYLKEGTCDKCGCSVPLNNSSLALEDVMAGGFCYIANDRHLFPVIFPPCVGSPTRVALILTNDEWKQAYEKIQLLKLELDV